MQKQQRANPALLRAVLTDVQFWVPVLVLALGILVLVFVHGK